MAYSAATPATDRKARFTRASNPGLFGAKGVSMSFEMPACSAARNIRLRRSKNCEAAKGSPKSAVSIAQALSYADHSGDSVSGVSSGFGAFLGISLTLSGVSTSQRYNTQPAISQNINKNVQSIGDHSAGNETLFGVVLTIIEKNLGALPVKKGRFGKMQAPLFKVPGRFGLVPFEPPVHSVAFHTVFGNTNYHRRSSPSKLYTYVDRPWTRSCFSQSRSATGVIS